MSIPRDDNGIPIYRCEICGHGYNSRREADLCAAVRDWDIFYGPDSFLHPNNNYDQMYEWRDE